MNLEIDRHPFNSLDNIGLLYVRILSTFLSLDYFPGDCTALHNQEPTLLSGLYRIQLPGISYVNVFCEMSLDGGGWTVVNPTY